MAFPFYRQLDQMDCGATCLRMIAKYYGKNFSIETLRSYTNITREGVSLLGISEAAEKIGFKTIMARITYQQLDEDAGLPCILFWKNQHFVVLPPQNSSRSQKILIADPAHGMVKLDRETFLQNWMGNTNAGIVLLLEPALTFSETADESQKSGNITFLFQYLKPYKKYIFQLFFSILLGSILSLIFPFLTQSLVDYGVNHENMGFITLILVSQLILFLGSTANNIIKSWILLHMSSRINISIIADFLTKLMNLPISYFDSKLVGDITQRINDHDRIERFLTNNTLNALFSLVNLFIFSIVLGVYSALILFIFLLGTAISIGWIQFYMHRRREVDYKRFQQMSANQSNMYELITGMQEIKLNNCETSKRWQWERTQAKLFHLNIKGLITEQYQQTGNVFFNQLKNILISYIAARQVVHGDITLGMMLSISFITGQLNSPIDSLLSFFHAAQDAKISLERLREIHRHPNEEAPVQEDEPIEDFRPTLKEDLVLENVSFQYGGDKSPSVLKDINLRIPHGKVTAIVGTSGSGKTTLLKLLLGFYTPTRGSLRLGAKELKELSPSWWRRQCGVVMQEGFIFSDTIARNINVSEDRMDVTSMKRAVNVANIEAFIEDLPLNYSTRIGYSGSGISTGQKQRLLIARAVYKNPHYIFFDEATSALDANNERIIIDRLNDFFEGKTVVIIAHRLSTVKHADQIILLENGHLVETGNHIELIRKKGKYFELVKNQLELGQ